MATKPKKKVYLAGPMTGMPDKNRPAFMTYEKRWQDAGWEVINPALFFGEDADPGVFVCRRRSVMELLPSDAIAMLPGWNDWTAMEERGHLSFCLKEYDLAGDLGMSLYWADQPEIPRGDG